MTSIIIGCLFVIIELILNSVVPLIILQFVVISGVVAAVAASVALSICVVVAVALSELFDQTFSCSSVWAVRVLHNLFAASQRSTGVKC